MKYLFVFGNTPDLAKAELEAVLSDRGLPYQPGISQGKVFMIDTRTEIPATIFDLLGGTVKVGEIIDNTDFSEFTVPKLNFGVSFLGTPDRTAWKKIFVLNKQIKDLLIEKGIKARFVLPQKRETELSSVVVKKQMLTEFLLFHSGQIGVEDLIAKTIWVQDFEDWGKRDYGRPAVEAHVGMLPPKVARMMINIAISRERLAESTILDPFCGTGTILMEALTIGLKAIGSDIDPRQVERTKKNLEWMGGSAQLYVCDAAKISQKVSMVDAIVTEADLGPSVTKNVQGIIYNVQSRLEKLYIDCLNDWKKILKPGGTVVIALPNTHVIDKAKAIGYILFGGPYLYARPQAKVKRNICVFKLNGTH